MYQVLNELIGVLIGVLIVIVPACLTYLFGKKIDRLRLEYKLKAEYYMNFINAFEKGKGGKKDFSELADAYNKLLLVANADVINQMLKLVEYINKNKEKYSIDKQNEIIRDLLKSMRLDLYKNKKINKDYPEEISLLTYDG